MKSNAQCFLQGRLGEYTYLYRISVFVNELQSDVTIGTIIANIKTNSTSLNICNARTPKYITSESLEALKENCLANAKSLLFFID